MSHEFNVAVLGGGPGGYECAIRCAQLGLKTALVEARELGGTCLNRGCIPTKALLHGAEVYAEAKAGGDFGLILDGLTLNYSRLAAYKDDKVKKLVSGIEALEKAHGVEVIRGFGVLDGPNAMKVGQRRITYDKLILATGSEPSRPPVPGMETAYTSDDVLCAINLPSGAIIIGGGVIGIEFATLFSALGKKVTVIEMTPDILPVPGCTPEITGKIKAVLKKRGVEFILGARVTEVVKGRTVRFEKDGKQDERTSATVIVCAGRRPVTRNCGLETIGLETDRRGYIEVDDHLRTSVKNIFAAGDAIDKRIPKLTPTAFFESQYIADLILGNTTEPICYPVVPNLVFTFPRIAQVGVTLDEARNDSKYRVVDIPYGQAFLFNTHNEATAKLAFIFDNESNLLVGAAAMGSDAGPWIDILSLVIFNKMTREQLAYYVYAFPTTTCGPLMMLGMFW